MNINLVKKKQPVLSEKLVDFVFLAHSSIMH